MILSRRKSRIWQSEVSQQGETHLCLSTLRFWWCMMVEQDGLDKRDEKMRFDFKWMPQWLADMNPSGFIQVLPDVAKKGKD